MSPDNPFAPFLARLDAIYDDLEAHVMADVEAIAAAAQLPAPERQLAALAILDNGDALNERYLGEVEAWPAWVAPLSDSVKKGLRGSIDFHAEIRQQRLEELALHRDSLGPRT